jgi:AcrR family transcriptional regulator
MRRIVGGRFSTIPASMLALHTHVRATNSVKVKSASTPNDPARKARTAYHHGDLRGALIEALRVLIERDGPDGFRIAEACRMAGVTTAAPYKHFKDRAAMLRAVALGGMERLATAMQAAADAHPGGAPARVVALGRCYVDFARAEPGVFRLMFGLAENHEDAPELQALGERAQGIVEGVVADHLGLPPTEDAVRLRAHALWCFVHGMSFLSLDGKAEAQDAATEDALLRLVGQAILPARPSA